MPPFVPVLDRRSNFRDKLFRLFKTRKKRRLAVLRLYLRFAVLVERRRQRVSVLRLEEHKPSRWIAGVVVAFEREVHVIFAGGAAERADVVSDLMIP